MSFLLHRDTCSAAVRGVRRPQGRFLQHQGQLHVSVNTIMQLELWLTMARTPLRYHQVYTAMMQSIRLLNVDEAVAHRAAGLGTHLRIQGLRLPTIDLLLAATALVQGLTLVTHSPQTYTAVPGLTTVDWLAP